MAKDERTFRYQKRSKDDVKERINMRGGNFDSFIKSKYKLYKVRDGKNLIRILPPTWEKARHYGYDIWVNYSIGVDNQSYLSLSKMKNEPDPLLEARRIAEREGDKTLIQALQPRQRILMWVIDRNDEDEGPQLWAAPFTVDKDLANISCDEDTKEIRYIDDPEEGFDFRFHKEGQGLKTEYPASKMKLIGPSPVHQDEKLQDEWIDFIVNNPIPECLQFYDYEHISQVFNGKAGRQDEDDAPKAPRRNAVRDAEVEEDDPKPTPRKRVPVEDEEPEPEVKPRRRAAQVEEDEPADVKPTRRRASVQEADPEPEEVTLSIKERLARRRSGVNREPPPDEDD